MLCALHAALYCSLETRLPALSIQLALPLVQGAVRC